jgi:hypothetical protein
MADSIQPAWYNAGVMNFALVSSSLRFGFIMPDVFFWQAVGSEKWPDDAYELAPF